MDHYKDIVGTMESSVNMLSCHAEGLCAEPAERPELLKKLRLAVHRLVVGMGALRSSQAPRQRHRHLRRYYEQVRSVGSLIDEFSPRIGLAHETLRAVREKILEIMVSLRLVFESGASVSWAHSQASSRSKTTRDRALLRPWSSGHAACSIQPIHL